MNRKAEQFHILIGKDKEGSYVFLDEAFKYSDGFKGLTGTKMEFHTEYEYEEAKENYLESGDLKDLRKEAVASDRTEQSYEDWSEDVVNEANIVYDDSYRRSYWIDEALEIIDEHEYEETGIHATSEFTNCVGGGRCFYEGMLKRDYRERVDEKNFKIFKKLFIEYEC